MPHPLTVLVLCTGNSARSIMAEAAMNFPAIGQGKFRAYSAGSHPRGTVHPLALELLGEHKIPTESLYSKSWDEFARPDSPVLDVILTVCDSAAAETCPVWPGHPTTAHWGLPDPAAVRGTTVDERRAFREAFTTIRRRIDLFASLPLADLDGIRLEQALQEIGRR
ncbi:MAG: arsenate reductase ArsC [Vicinamibacterales bacterium]